MSALGSQAARQPPPGGGAQGAGARLTGARSPRLGIFLQRVWPGDDRDPYRTFHLRIMRRLRQICCLPLRNSAPRWALVVAVAAHRIAHDEELIRRTSAVQVVVDTQAAREGLAGFEGQLDEPARCVPGEWCPLAPRQRPDAKTDPGVERFLPARAALYARARAEMARQERARLGRRRRPRLKAGPTPSRTAIAAEVTAPRNIPSAPGSGPTERWAFPTRWRCACCPTTRGTSG